VCIAGVGFVAGVGGGGGCDGVCARGEGLGFLVEAGLWFQYAVLCFEDALMICPARIGCRRARGSQARYRGVKSVNDCYRSRRATPRRTTHRTLVSGFTSKVRSVCEGLSVEALLDGFGLHVRGWGCAGCARWGNGTLGFKGGDLHVVGHVAGGGFF
jgi:hypothetical protein